jgi:hypothetical protein
MKRRHFKTAFALQALGRHPLRDEGENTKTSSADTNETTMMYLSLQERGRPIYL